MNKEKRKRYASNWAFISADIRYNRAQNKCEQCYFKNGSIVYTNHQGKREEASFEQLDEVYKMIERTGIREATVLKSLGLVKIILTVAHLDHNEKNNDYFNLKALCQKCHLNHDRDNNRLRRQQYKNKFKATVIE